MVAYTLPLRFVGSMVLDGLVGLDKQIRIGTPNTVEPEFFMTFYSGGFVAIFLLLACLHWWAWAKRGALSLDELERYVTKTEIRSHLLTASVGILSLVLVWLLNVRVARPRSTNSSFEKLVFQSLPKRVFSWPIRTAML